MFVSRHDFPSSLCSRSFYRLGRSVISHFVFATSQLGDEREPRRIIQCGIFSSIGFVERQHPITTFDDKRKNCDPTNPLKDLAPINTDAILFISTVLNGPSTHNSCCSCWHGKKAYLRINRSIRFFRSEEKDKVMLAITMSTIFKFIASNNLKAISRPFFGQWILFNAWHISQPFHLFPIFDYLPFVRHTFLPFVLFFVPSFLPYPEEYPFNPDSYFLPVSPRFARETRYWVTATLRCA